MAPQAPQLPTKFPCWCRAVYSWGGETKKDLGFVEGDLIECLNAGDGSWWTGRLRRDRRMVGLFPSNFVKVLADDFVPANRTVSPLPPTLQNNDSLRSNNSASGPKKHKTVFRKPFQGYKEVIGPSDELRRKNAEKEAEVAAAAAAAAAAAEAEAAAAATLRARLKYNDKPKKSPTPSESKSTAMVRYYKRNTTPRVPSHAASPVSVTTVIMAREPSPPPPPPPPHRVLERYNSQVRPRSSAIGQEQDYRRARYSNQSAYRAQTPCSPTTSAHGQTPSPLRDAMHDVMSSLDDMDMTRNAPSPENRRSASPFQPWSPDSFNDIKQQDTREFHNGASTSLGFADSHKRESSGDARDIQAGGSVQGSFRDGPPQLNNYVQRMESRLRQLHDQEEKSSGKNNVTDEDEDNPPPPPPRKGEPNYGRKQGQKLLLNHRKSAYELRGQAIGRTSTVKSSATNSSSGVQSNTTHSSTTSTALTTPSLMSGASAGEFSATSAGSLAKRNQMNSPLRHGATTSMDNVRSNGFTGFNDNNESQTRPYTPSVSNSNHSRQGATSAVGWTEYNRNTESPGVFGGLTTPKSRKTGFFKKILESAKTGAASARSNIATSQGRGSAFPTKSFISTSISNLSPSKRARSATNDTNSGTSDWIQVRRDVNRSTSPSRNELIERAERCQMLDYPVIYAVEELYESAEADEGIDGLPIVEPTNWAAVNLQLVDKSSRFINGLPAMITPTNLAQGYICRPYRSDIQRLRAIFTWVGEKIAWDDDIEGDVDVRRVIQFKRGCAKEVAVLVFELCSAVGLHAEVVQGYLKIPGEQYDVENLSRPNHWWNTVLIDGEWRAMDCFLASPTSPRRVIYSTTNPQAAESWYFLARPMEICYTHIPMAPEHQHICPPISPEVLLALPCACPGYFKNGLNMPTYDTSLVRLNDLEILQVRVHVPPDIECVAEVEAIAFARDADGDFFESGDIIKKRALCQADWVNGQKRFTIKAVLPGDEGQGILKVYAGRKGLMHSSKDIPHSIAFALPIYHTGDNPYYDFLIRHPTPHAQRHDLYVIQPQCFKLAINNTFVFAVRQHPSSQQVLDSPDVAGGRASPNPFARPTSALSMVSSIATISNVSTVSSLSGQQVSSASSVSSGGSKQHSGREKPAKLAIQSPSGKILRFTRKADHMITTSTGGDSASDGPSQGSIWETVIKVSEPGLWRGLVLADRTARWCVWGEWECY